MGNKTIYLFSPNKLNKENLNKVVLNLQKQHIWVHTALYRELKKFSMRISWKTVMQKIILGKWNLNRMENEIFSHCIKYKLEDLLPAKNKKI